MKDHSIGNEQVKEFFVATRCGQVYFSIPFLQQFYPTGERRNNRLATAIVGKKLAQYLANL
jgi:hypothetical protein